VRDEEDLTAVAEQATVEAVLDAAGFGQATFPNRMLIERRYDTAEAILRALRQFRGTTPFPDEAAPRVTTDTNVLIAAMRTYFGDVTTIISERGERDAQLAAHLPALEQLGQQILAAVRPVAASLTEADLADLEATRDRTTGSWSRLAGLLLDLVEVEREQRLEAVHAEQQGYRPYGVVDMVPGTFGRQS
jgi:hypothetical protein